jgi:hypothetical protein
MRGFFDDQKLLLCRKPPPASDAHRRRCSTTRKTASASIPRRIWPDMPASCRSTPMMGTTSCIWRDASRGRRPFFAMADIDGNGETSYFSYQKLFPHVNEFSLFRQTRADSSISPDRRGGRPSSVIPTLVPSSDGKEAWVTKKPGVDPATLVEASSKHLPNANSKYAYDVRRQRQHVSAQLTLGTNRSELAAVLCSRLQDLAIRYPREAIR